MISTEELELIRQKCLEMVVPAIIRKDIFRLIDEVQLLQIENQQLKRIAGSVN